MRLWGPPIKGPKGRQLKSTSLIDRSILRWKGLVNITFTKGRLYNVERPYIVIKESQCSNYVCTVGTVLSLHNFHISL